MAIRQDELAKNIVDVDEKILQMPAYTSLVANQREYALPDETLSGFDRVEAKLDGTNYIKLDEMSSSSMQDTLLSETIITGNFSNEYGMAYFTLARKAITIYSGTISNVTDGLRFWVNIWPSPVTDLTGTTDMGIDPTTTSFGMPRELHEIWARGVIIDYKSSREKPLPLTEREQMYDEDKLTAIQSLSPGYRDRTVFASIPYNDGSQY